MIPPFSQSLFSPPNKKLNLNMGKKELDKMQASLCEKEKRKSILGPKTVASHSLKWMKITTGFLYGIVLYAKSLPSHYAN
jgi:hypothetical protein